MLKSSIRTLVPMVLLLGSAPGAYAQERPQDQPWLDPTLSPDERTAAVLKVMTQDEKFHYLTTEFGARMVGGPPSMDVTPPEGSLGTPGFLAAIPRLGLPALHEADGPLGVANTNNMRPGDTATPLPSGILTAATWNPQLAFDGGAMIAGEARSKGFNVLLAGGVNLAREARNGRNFEYAGEDPLLAGRTVGASIKGIQSRHVVSTIKHFAANAQETGRSSVSSNIGIAAMRESDLLAFQIAIEQGDPGSVMCGYNRVNGEHACENDYLLNQVLKRDWHYRGWVMSDFGGVHSSAKAALAGLDQQSSYKIDSAPFFREPLRQAVREGTVPQSRIDDMAGRVLRSMFAHGLVDDRAVPGGTIDVEANAAVTRRIAQEGIVLLKNALPDRTPLLPIVSTKVRRIAVIGGHADVGVLSGGAGQVMPIGGPGLILVDNKPLGASTSKLFQFLTVYDPSSPLKAIRAAAPGAKIEFDDGTDPARAAAFARGADVVVLFATKWSVEAKDDLDLSLPYGQDALIAAVAGANPRTVVVLETGAAVTTPWVDKVGGLLAAWYPGARGGEAIADVLFGAVNPSGKLPISFPRSVDQLPDPLSPTRWAEIARTSTPFRGNPFDVAYPEGAAVGYKWYASKGLTPAFPFGFGLSYTRFAIGAPSASMTSAPTIRFSVRNTGRRAGREVAQVYATPPGVGALPRLVGWQKIDLKPGETREVSVEVDARLLAAFDETDGNWKVAAGSYVFRVGNSFADATRKTTLDLTKRSIAP